MFKHLVCTFVLNALNGCTDSASTLSSIHYASSPITHIETQLVQGQTLSGILAHHNLSNKEILTLTHLLSPYVNPHQLAAGQKIQLEQEAGQVTRLSLNHKFGYRLSLEQDEGNWHIREHRLPTQRLTKQAKVEIKDSFYQAAQDNKVPVSVINQAIVPLSHFIDFQRDIHKGSQLRLDYHIEMQLEKGDAKRGTSQLNLVYLHTNKDSIKLYRYPLNEPDSPFYDEQGKIAASFLLKTPIDGARLSSRFGKRYHPVLGYKRNHKGLDFGAPLNTPIMAAGDGVIVHSGRMGSFGILVKIAHKGGFDTLYAHLNGISKGIKKGSRVKQGQVIGFLGNTGLSQSRHLHYEVHQQGKAINPLSLPKVDAYRLKGEKLAEFRRYVASVETPLLSQTQLSE